MGTAIAVRRDYPSRELRRLATRVKDAAQARRLLAIAAVVDGSWPASALTASRQLPSTAAADCGFQFGRRDHTIGGDSIAGSVPQSKGDDDVGRFGLVQLQIRRAVVAPAGQIHDHGGLPGRLDRLHDVEPVAVEEERVFAEQIVELWNHRMVVGNGPGFELAQSSLELCRVKFHCALLSFAPKRCALLRFAGPPTQSSNANRGGQNAKLGYPAWPT